jgi:hypothetical protein
MANIRYKSSTLECYDINFKSCMNFLRLLECIEEYLPYEHK